MKTNLCGKMSFRSRLKSDFKRNWGIYLIMLPVIIYYILFYYKPMYGAIIAFKEYQPALGIMGSPWVGLEQFKKIFLNPDFYAKLKNTLVISFTGLVFGFPVPILLALLFNEIKNRRFKAIAQSLSYIPHFISLVVICGLIKQFVGPGGIIYNMVVALGGEEIGLLSRSECFVPIYLLSNIWQGAGWDSILYIAALSAINQELFEAAKVDGAGKFGQVIHVVIPGIAPTIIIMLILRLGQILSVGYEKIILLYNPLIYDTSDVIMSYVYRMGITQQSWSFSTAVGLVNSAVSILMIVISNKISRTFSETSLW